MSSHAPARSTASPSQLAYLRNLAVQTGTTFSPPQTGHQAGCEIDRLKALKASRGTHSEIPRDMDPAEQPYATAVAPGEVSGFGSQASWRTDSPVAPGAAAKRSEVGELTELARYEVHSGERVLYGQRIDGCVRITDRPACGPGRSYLVERELQRDGLQALNALVADYLQQAGELDEVPMATNIVGLQLEQLSREA